MDSTVIESGGYHAVDLGNVSAGNHVDISFVSYVEIDGLLMTNDQYDSWVSGGSEYIRDGSAIGQTIEMYTYTITANDHYWYVLDNSNQNPGGTNSGTESTISTGGINTQAPLIDGSKTRSMVNPGTMVSYDLGIVPEGMILDLSVTCEHLISDEVDIFVVSGSEKSDFESGGSVWNKHASYLGTCFETWSYEVEKTDSWTVYIENGPRGSANENSNPIQVDVNFWARLLLPVEITSNTRMIETGEAWRVDLGAVSSGDTLTFSLGLDGIFDKLDVLIMDHDQADLFLSGESATVLGHPSLIDVDFFDSWDYRFPQSGSFSLILDNSAEPQGGSNVGSPVHAEILVIETTLVTNWVGWYQSRHYVEDGEFVSFDLGQLEEGDEFSYVVSGQPHGSGFMNRFDVLVFEDAGYQNYTSGADESPLANYSRLNEWFSSYLDANVAESAHYWVVIDAADGPAGTPSADSNGAWTFDFTITSENVISSPQMMDANYKMTATNLGSNSQSDPDDDTGSETGSDPVSDPDDDTGSDTGSDLDDDTGSDTDDDTGSDTGSDTDGDSTTEDEDLTDIGEAKETSETPGFGVIAAVFAISIVAIVRTGRHR